MGRLHNIWFKSFIFAGGLLSTTGAMAAGLEFTGGTLPVLEYDADSSSGLEKIYVVYDIEGMEISYISTSGVQSWQRFSNMGGGYAEDVAYSREGDTYRLISPAGNIGYIINENGRQHCFWIVQYKGNELSLNSASVSDESDCDFTILNVSGHGDAIHYYTVNGQPKVLSREIRVEYDNQVWNSDAKTYAATVEVKSFESLGSRLTITPPVYCSTAFRIVGDRFLESWGMPREVETSVSAPRAVSVESDAEQKSSIDPDVPSNVIRGDDSGLGGSAPADITFTAYCTEGVLHDEWQMSRDVDFDTIDYRFNERELNYVFEEEGTFYLRFIGSNSDGSCESIGETYTVNIGASDLLCPNAFSPDGDGVNDEWKVSYRSLIEFKCWIFDRYGNEMCHFTNPDQGWDGKRNGKTVAPGVYFYVIQAKGADGKKYKKTGDINILRYKSYGESSGADS